MNPVSFAFIFCRDIIGVSVPLHDTNCFGKRFICLIGTQVAPVKPDISGHGCFGEYLK